MRLTLIHCFRSFLQALGLRRDDTFSTTMLNSTIEQLVNDMPTGAGDWFKLDLLRISALSYWVAGVIGTRRRDHGWRDIDRSRSCMMCDCLCNIAVHWVSALLLVWLLCKLGTHCPCLSSLHTPPTNLKTAILQILFELNRMVYQVISSNFHYIVIVLLLNSLIWLVVKPIYDIIIWCGKHSIPVFVCCVIMVYIIPTTTTKLQQ